MVEVEQTIVFATLALALVLFAHGRWRYDLVALFALLAVTVTGVVPADEAFLGFGHPAVITVAAVLIASRALTNAGIVEVFANLLGKVGGGRLVQITCLTALVAILSAFMNNVGALALLMPVTIRLARKSETPVSILLMPLAFGSLLGGLMTLIGTPPNIIIATFRAENGPGPFLMFDFLPVGGGVALAGVTFVSLAGWRLIPKRAGRASAQELFEIEDYISEVRVPEGAKVVGETLGELGSEHGGGVQVLSLIRGKRRILAPRGFERIEAGDVLAVEADAEELKELVDTAGLELVGGEKLHEEDLGSEDVSVVEAVVKAGSPIEGRTAEDLWLRRAHGVNLLGVARHGSRVRERLGRTRLRAGDVLLLQGPAESFPETLSTLGCLPLAERDVRIGQPRRIAAAAGIFGAALACAATGLLPIQVAFVSAAATMVVVGLIPLREAYASIDWPVIVLLGAMIPVGQALETTGGAERIADAILRGGAGLPPAAVIAILLVGTMLLSDIVNNAAAALLMAPIALGVAAGFGISADPFLMAVALGASCAFLTPIGHQSNTLVMGPGGYHFGDYWRMGLPLDVVIVAVGLPLILWVWPPAAVGS